MSFLDRLKKAVGVAAMTNPVTAFAWQGYKLADKSNKSPAPKAPPAASDPVSVHISDEHEAAMMAGGSEMDAFMRGRADRTPYYFPTFIKGDKIDDDDLLSPTFKSPRLRRSGGRDDLASPTRGKLPSMPKGGPDDRAAPSRERVRAPRGGSDDLMGFACQILGQAPPAPANMNKLASNSVVSHDVFRAIVWRNACKASGGKKPDAATIAASQAAVLQFLKLKGIRISLPGAKPGRRTV